MLVSWSWEWASCTIFSRAVVDKKLKSMTREELLKSLAKHKIPVKNK